MRIFYFALVVCILRYYFSKLKYFYTIIAVNSFKIPLKIQSMFYIISKILTIFLLPLTWIFFLFVLSLVFKNERRKRIFRNLGIGVFVLFGNFPLVSTIMDRWEGPMEQGQRNAHATVGIVLGGGQVNDHASTMGVLYFDHSVDRLLQAIQLYKKHQISKILVTSGSLYPKHPEWSEADFSATFLKDQGVPANHILIERKAKNTYENAVFTKELLVQNQLVGQPCLLITSAYHMKRSLGCYAKQGLKCIPYPCNWQDTSGQWTDPLDHIPQWHAFYLWYTLLKEWFGLATYKIMGYI
jgi:uncharacterized SAM-binding protein YcdF (DUF218 family)